MSETASQQRWLQQELAHLVRVAAEYGYVLHIDHVPRVPLAQGNFDMVPSVRRALPAIRKEEHDRQAQAAHAGQAAEKGHQHAGPPS